MALVTFTVTTTGAVSAYWIAVGNDDVELNGGKGAIDLTAGHYFLVWHFMGDPGSSISIVGADDTGKSLVEVKQSTVQPEEGSRAGFRGFDV